ncbi:MULTISPECIES: nucleotide exchange factor GrpE [Arthrobacter]|jgi:molecular chaperone GrpE|uniref:nucleotide exchange factor GrpE n=1 Tax=Arthrobacter TaxID=1663 RepID=UPI001AAF0B7D|nr:MULTISPECIES: nucleotide exchange factor GrpE [Arthrobacter]QTF72729.1 nucleotide exchange factor GrpE [Arthrobacter woluwensis]WFR83831.1 nucleotide exchange factor GrpE [Arthrobacter sp. Y-9]
MPHHGNEAEHGSGTGDERQEPVIRDNRKVDPETGQARTPQGSEAPAGGGATDANGDALSQAEEILNAAGADAGNTPSSSEAEELRNDLLRLQAEYVNYRKRVERDRAVAGEMAVIGVLNAILPVMDDIDAARAHGDLSDGPFAAIAGKLENTLKTYGLERIEETGVEFDPTIHEALIQQPGEVEVDTVSQVLRAGYRTSSRVLRAAQVIVAVPQ